MTADRFFTAAFPLAACLLFTGCAAIVEGTDQTLRVETPGCTGARCKLANEKGIWYVPSTPGSVTVHRAYGALTATCVKEGVKSDAIDSVESTTKGMAFGNILLGGVIGAGVDVGTGAAYDYPPVISIPMDCSAVDAVATSADVPPRAGVDDAQTTDMTTRSLPADAGECVELERKIMAARGDAFTRDVLKSVYTGRCAPQQPEAPTGPDPVE